MTILVFNTGSAGVDAFVYTQMQPSLQWIINHNLRRHPVVDVVTSSGDLVDCAITYASANQVVLTFTNPFSGTAYLN